MKVKLTRTELGLVRRFSKSADPSVRKKLARASLFGAVVSFDFEVGEVNQLISCLGMAGNSTNDEELQSKLVNLVDRLEAREDEEEDALPLD